MKSVYVDYLDGTQKKIALEMYKSKQRLKEHHIKIIDEVRSEPEFNGRLFGERLHS